MKCDFSFRHYYEILKTAIDSGYDFVSYEEISSHSGKACVLRHDVDYMPEKCRDFAEAENKLGIRAWYFFQVCCEIYNIRDAKTFAVIHELKKAGHHIGLHFDASWNPELDWKDIALQCAEEKKIFETLTGIEPEDIITFHNTHKFHDLVLNKKIPGMHHGYEARYFSEIKYLSDSQGWYEGCPCKIFASGKYEKIQLLLHPYIWDENPGAGFTEDMAAMTKYKTRKLVEYLIRYHPVAAKNKDQLNNLSGIN